MKPPDLEFGPIQILRTNLDVKNALLKKLYDELLILDGLAIEHGINLERTEKVLNQYRKFMEGVK